MADGGGKAAQRGPKATDDLSTDLSCPICLDFFSDPVSLRCGHNFCRECIQHAWTQPAHACPQCRQQCNSLDVNSNRLLASIVDGFQRLWNPNRASTPPLRCQLHQQELGFFCSDDLQLVCRVCWRSEEHRNHSRTTISEAYKICK
eukprot:g16801.t1